MLNWTGCGYSYSILTRDYCSVDASIFRSQHLQEVADIVWNGSQRELAPLVPRWEQYRDVRKTINVLESYNWNKVGKQIYILYFIPTDTTKFLQNE